MNPFDQPSSPAVPGLNPIGEVNTFAPASPKPDKPPTKGAAALQEIDTLQKLLVPVTAAAGAVLKPESFLGQKALTLLTGFKVGETEGAFNKLTPGAAMFLAPEPIGLLPERGFQSKPRIPGTKVYLDPMYNYTRYDERKKAERREDVGSVQLKLLNELLPQLTTDQLSTLKFDQGLRQRSLTYIPPRFVDQTLDAELEKRRLAGQQLQLGQPARVEGIGTSPAEVTAAEAIYRYLAGDAQGTVDQLAFLTQPQSADAMAASVEADAEAARLLNVRRAEVSAAGVFGLGELLGPDALFAALPPDP